jgi:predicted ATPase
MLKRVSIQNFKSLKDVTLDLQKVNLLIGPNNSGKTNFLKAVEYCGYIQNHQSDLETDQHSKIEKIDLSKEAQRRLFERTVFGQRWENTIRISLTVSFIENEGNIEKNFDLAWTSKELRIITRPSFNINTTRHLRNLLGELTIYKPDPNKLSHPGPVGIGKESVNADTSNLVGFLDLMLGKYRRSTFNRIETDLQKCIPEFDEINLDDSPPTEELKKQFGDKSFKKLGLTSSKQGITYWADELSEGTLYFLALLAIINQPNPPKLLLLEEPERGIHPRRIREVMDFIFRLADEKDIQIILTTHNEHVLDDFSTRPESVFVFDKDEEGATYVRNLQKDIIDPTNQRNRELGLDEIDLTTNLSENWLYGLLGGVPAIP